MIRIAIFGSGNGSNAQNICEYFNGNKHIEVGCIIYNRKDAYIAQRAQLLNIPNSYFSKEQFNNDASVLEYLQAHKIDYIVLAGFLLLLPKSLIDAYRDKIFNIHPSLLPKYGGKGMYGDFVHQEVIKNHEKESGITIHLVNDHYDQGDILFQKQCPVEEFDTAQTLAARIHELEYHYYPQVIEKTILNK